MYVERMFQELHAHLNGSLSADTLQELIQLQKSNSGHGDVVYSVWEAIIQHGNKRTLEEYVALTHFTK